MKIKKNGKLLFVQPNFEYTCIFEYEGSKNNSKKEKEIITKIDKIIHRLDTLNIYGESTYEAGRRRCQGTINKVYDELLELKKELKGE